MNSSSRDSGEELPEEQRPAESSSLLSRPQSRVTFGTQAVALETALDDDAVPLILGRTESRVAQLRHSLVELLRKEKWKLLFTLSILALLITGAYFFTRDREALKEPGDENYGITGTQPLVLPMSLKSPIAFVKVTLTLPPVVHVGNGSYIFLRLIERASDTAEPEQVGPTWTLLLEHESSVTEHRFDGPRYFSKDEPGAALYLNITTDHGPPLGITVHVIQQGSIAAYSVAIGLVILVSLYTLIVSEVIDRTVSAMLGSFVTLSALALIDERPTLETIVSWIEYETLSLLFGMMLMVGIYSKTGFFEWAAVQAYKLSRGSIWRLMLLLCVFIAVLSALLDDVTTVLLLTPVTIQLCNVLNMSPVPLLIAEIIFSNIGGASSSIGNPCNVILIADKDVKAQGITVLEFSLHLAPAAILCGIAAWWLLRVQYRGKFDQVRPRTALECEIEIWRKTLASMPASHGAGEEEVHVRTLMSQHISSLDEIRARETRGVGAGPDIAELEAKYRIHNMPVFVNCTIVMGVVMLLFFLHSAVSIYLNLSWIAILGALCMLIITRVHSIDEVLEHVEWGTLLFFASLFIMMEGLTELGVVDAIGSKLAAWIESVPQSSRLATAILLIVWISALASAAIDNVPYMQAMLPIVINLGKNREVNLPMKPLLWALAVGTCLGGISTLTAQAGNIVVAGMSQKAGHPITFNAYFKIGFPSMLVTTMVGSLYLILCHVVFSWNH